ncbi:hypothetical protein ACPPVW_18170 [Leifsonia sp. McL0607]|uniref:hypothetical protein n=1 Tax=Leifsonia sp. McL0607 TaxID=3415672 RepID=UPI003CEFA0AE
MGQAAAADAGERVLELQARIRAMQGSRLEERRLPAQDAIAELLPGGALMTGAAYTVSGSMTLLQGMLAGVSAAGGWCAVVGMPDFGVEAAAAAGVDLDRLVLVPHPGKQWWPALSTLVEIMTAVAVRPSSRPASGDLARLTGKLRQHESVLLVDGMWPGARASLTGAGGTVAGIGTGHGLLTSRQLAVDVTDRTGRIHRRHVDVDERGMLAPESRERPALVRQLHTG